MKRFIVGMILLFTLLELGNANNITNSYWTGNGINKHKVSTVQCNNSSIVIIGYYPNNISAKYFSDGGIYYSWDEAIRKSCGNNKKKTYVKKKALICENRKLMQNALESEINYLIERSKGKGCFTINKKIKVNILKSFGKETFMELYDENKPKRKAVRIDTYLKISDSDNIYYVRSSDLQ